MYSIIIRIITNDESRSTTDQQIAQEQVLEILPLVTEVNAISEEINKQRTFEVVLISAAAQEGGLNSNVGTQLVCRGGRP